MIISRSCLISLLTPYPLAARWKVSGVISISEHRTTATVSKNSRNSASSSALKWKKILWNVYENLREKQYDSFVIWENSWITSVYNFYSLLLWFQILAFLVLIDLDLERQIEKMRRFYLICRKYFSRISFKQSSTGNFVLMILSSTTFYVDVICI